MVGVKQITLIALAVVLVQGSKITSQVDFVNPKGLAYTKSKKLFSASQKNIESSAARLLTGHVSYITEQKATAPSGDIHDYYSWAVYYSPDSACVKKNPKNYMSKCTYVRHDGTFASDLDLLPGSGWLSDMSNIAGSTAVAYYYNGEEKYAARAAEVIRGWFLNPKTKMNPNLNYGQVIRGPPGPSGWTGRKDALPDMRDLVYVTAAAKLIESSKSWTTSDRSGLVKWFTDFDNWYLTSSEGQTASTATNNIETWYRVGRVAYLSYANKTEEAKTVIQDFLKGSFLQQINANGEQSKEAARSNGWHYQCFNLEALLYLAHAADSLGINMWHAKTAKGATIQTAMDYLISYASSHKVTEDMCGRQVYIVGKAYGDPNGKYMKAFAKFEPKVTAADYFLWDVPATDLKSKRRLSYD